MSTAAVYTYVHVHATVIASAIVLGSEQWNVVQEEE